jgi:hypothetical protein
MRPQSVAVYPFADIWTLLISTTVIVGCFCHFFRIDELPMGFYVDESSIGYNAHLISQTGADEHGARWPLFFEAFGEYKNPLYIYLLAGMYRIFGYSEWTTRALSACCWLLGSCLLYALTLRLFADKTTRLYVALSLAFTPWLFALSRVSFELISLYPLLALHLLALHRGFEESSPRWALVSGMAIALCVYAYTTFRLLAPLYAILALLCCFAPQHRRLRFPFALGAAVSASPFAVYTLHHMDNLAGRFDSLTYVSDPALPGFSKAAIFLTNYMDYFSPSFLALSGDPNLRHHTGYGGELLIPTVLLLCVALAALRNDWRSPFRLYLVGGLLLAPVAAALTTDAHHSLRAFSLVVFAIILSAYAFRTLTLVVARSAVALTAACALLYVINYFAFYPPASAIAFESYGFKHTLNEALVHTRGRVILSDEGNVPYINLLFFGSLSGTRIPLLCGSRRDARPGDVYIFYDPGRGAKGMYGIDAEAAKGVLQNLNGQ